MYLNTTPYRCFSDKKYSEKFDDFVKDVKDKEKQAYKNNAQAEQMARTVRFIHSGYSFTKRNAKESIITNKR